MNLVEFIVGARPRWRIDEPPQNVKWRQARPKPTNPVRAWRAEGETHVETEGGVLVARGGADYIVQYEDGARAIVRDDIFQRTYTSIGGGVFEKHTEIVLNYFVLDRDAVVETLEGDQHAKRGDWVVEGVAGELWPVPRAKAREKYDRL